MPAAKEGRVAPDQIKKLGIIAGGGMLPQKLLSSCDANGIDVFIIGFEGQTDKKIIAGREHMLTRIGAAGQIIKTLHTHDIKDLVLIGSIRRPTLSELRPDFKTVQFFSKVALQAMGDDGLLKALRGALEDEGFCIHGIHKFSADLLAPAGAIGKCKPKKEHWPEIKRGYEAAKTLGELDIGQAVIVQEGHILGVEAAEGTDELIKRCAPYRRKGRGGVLVKICKPQQDKDLDMPTIGPETIKLASTIGLSGIVVEAGESLIVDQQDVATLADKYKMFVYGLSDKDLEDGK